MSLINRLVFNQIPKSKWLFSLVAWFAFFGMYVISAYIDEMHKINAVSNRYFELNFSDAASIHDVLMKSDFPFSLAFMTSFFAIFISIALIFILKSKLTEDSHVGWRRIYFLLPGLATVTAALMVLSSSDAGIKTLLPLIFFSCPAAAFGFIISFGLMWIKDGFKK